MKIDVTKYRHLVMHFNNQEIIFNENDPGDKMYIVLKGTVEVRKKTVDAEKTLMAMKAGDIFGEMALIDGSMRSAKAVAIEDVKVLAVNETMFEKMVLGNNEFALKVIKILSSRIRNTNKHLKELLSQSRQLIVYNALKEYAEISGVTSYKGKKVKSVAFINWAIEHIGINNNEIKEILKELIIKEYVLKGAGIDELIIAKDKIVKF